ncbi:phospholipase D family protein [Hydrogenovibrio kuenenii]|uniref:phospholipase D family protein n=1 Tax=Hydrogenovibrio kuenenii TaxID=63658 RepID=UPI000465F748|nr:phospholipase D family protein [Hydrogenovibrio kuenenii]
MTKAADDGFDFLNAEGAIPPVSDALSLTDAFDTTGLSESLSDGLSGFYSLSSPVDALAARLLMIDRAQHRLCLQYYLFKEDMIGSLLIDRLLKAADRGVEIQLLLDDLQGARRGASFALLANHPKVEIRLFNPNLFRGLFRGLVLLFNMEKLGHRMHNKAMIADSEVALFGGRNIGTEYFLSDENRMFLDYDVLTFGPISLQVQLAFDNYWQSSESKELNQLDVALYAIKNRQRNHWRHQQIISHFETMPIAELLKQSPLQKASHQEPLSLELAHANLLVDPPEKVSAYYAEKHSLAYQLTYEIEVEKSLVLVSPYFIPTHAGLERFRDYIKQGVKVRILTNSLASTDVTLVYSAYQHYQKALLEMGVELYELRPKGWLVNWVQTLLAKLKWVDTNWLKSHHLLQYWHRHQLSLHTKLVIIDDRYLLIGSANADPRSRKLNTEMLAVIDSEAMAKQENDQLNEILEAGVFYQLTLINGKVAWHYRKGCREKMVFVPPEASHWRKITSKLMGLLPIEGYL